MRALSDPHRLFGRISVHLHIRPEGDTPRVNMSAESVVGFVRRVDGLVCQLDALTTDVDVRRRASHAARPCQASKVASQAGMLHPGET
jgi:hypothetical protein